MQIDKKVFKERTLVVILFVTVLIIFSFAEREAKKLDKIYYGFRIKSASPYVSAGPVHPAENMHSPKSRPAQE